MAKYVFPIIGGTWSDTWGASRGGGKRTHKGQDIFAPVGAAIVAPADGVISKADNVDSHTGGGDSGGDLGGITIWLTDIHGMAWYFAHNDRNFVETGQKVKQGQQIATVGNTGNAAKTPSHCHLGIKRGGRSGTYINPAPILESAERISQPGDTGSGFGLADAASAGIPGLGGIGGLSTIGNALGVNLPNPISAASGAVSSVGDFLSFIVSPELWVRVLSVLVGILLAGAGVGMIISDTRAGALAGAAS